MAGYNHRNGGNGFRGAASAFQKRFFKRGDVVWVRQSQNLSASGDNQTPDYKIRPFIVLADVGFEINGYGETTKPVALLGISCTSKDFLVDGRPHIVIELPNQNVESFAFPDSLREVSVEVGTLLRLDYRLPSILMKELSQQIDFVLQPENSFYLRRLFRGHKPGQIWDIENRAGKGTGLILLRRGRHVVDEDIDQGITNHLSYTPYMVAMFRGGAAPTTMRGVAWNELEITAVHERAFTKQAGEMGVDTVAALLNSLRGRVGLAPIAYREPTMTSLFNWMPMIFSHRILRL